MWTSKKRKITLKKKNTSMKRRMAEKDNTGEAFAICEIDSFSRERQQMELFVKTIEKTNVKMKRDQIRYCGQNLSANFLLTLKNEGRLDRKSVV